MNPAVLVLGALLLGATPQLPAATSPGAPSPGSAAATPTKKSGPARCSASGLSSEPTPAQPPLPPAVESMRRRIIAAAVACDYVALAVLARENGSRFDFISSYSGGRTDDVAGFWRWKEEELGEPLLARLVKVLNLPYAQVRDGFFWPEMSVRPLTPGDSKVIGELYPADKVPDLLSNQSDPREYDGLRVVILARGDWLVANGGLWSEWPWTREKKP